MIFKTKEEILKELIERAKSEADYLNWVPKSVQSDLFLGLFSSISYSLSVLSEYVKRVGTLSGLEDLCKDTVFQEALAEVLNLSEDDLTSLLKKDVDNLLEAYGFPRRLGRKASGIVRFYFSSNDPVTIPRGTRVYTSPPLSKNYYTVVEIKNKVPNPPSGSSPYYWIDVLVEAESPGFSYNVLAKSIRYADISIPSLKYVENPGNFCNGRDEEDNLSYIERVKKLRYFQRAGTVQFLYNAISENFPVFDICIIPLGNVFLQRPYGLDIYIISEEELETVTETVNYLPFYFSRQPVVEILEYPPGDIVWKKSEFPSPYYRSVYSDERLEGTLTSGGSVIYHSNSLVRRIQRYIDTFDATYGPRKNFVVKEGRKLLANIFVKLEPLPNYTFSGVCLAVRNNLFQYFSKFKFGQILEVSDILKIILNTEGVDRVDLDSFSVTVVVGLTGEELRLMVDVQDVYIPLSIEYFRLGSVEIQRIVQPPV